MNACKQTSVIAGVTTHIPLILLRVGDVNNVCRLQAILMESIHTFGLCLMIVKVLPELDIIRCLLIMCGVGLVPSLLNLFLGLRPKNNTGKKVGFFILDLLAVICQLSVLIVVLFLDFDASQGKISIAVALVVKAVRFNSKSALIGSGSLAFSFEAGRWETAVAVVCIGFSWRENFYNDDLSCCSTTLSATKLKAHLYSAQAKLYFIISIVKVILDGNKVCLSEI